jgi:hypothetical protein
MVAYAHGKHKWKDHSLGKKLNSISKISKAKRVEVWLKW